MSDQCTQKTYATENRNKKCADDLKRKMNLWNQWSSPRYIALG